AGGPLFRRCRCRAQSRRLAAGRADGGAVQGHAYGLCPHLVRAGRDGAVGRVASACGAARPARQGGMTAPPTSLRALRGQSGPEPEIPVETPAEILAETDAGRRNMRLLIQLRWIAVGGQLATIGIVQLLMGVDLPLAQLLLAPLLL